MTDIVEAIARAIAFECGYRGDQIHHLADAQAAYTIVKQRIDELEEALRKVDLRLTTLSATFVSQGKHAVSDKIDGWQDELRATLTGAK